MKLGYGGTKTEMERLLADAGKIAGVKFDISNYSDVIEAIHVMQEQMGIAGTTAEEASTTIQGSLGMVKSSWENLVTGLADKDADLSTLITNFVDSLGIAAENLIPVVEQALLGAGRLIEELLPKLLDRIPYLLTTVLPKLLESGKNMLRSLIDGINNNLDLVMDSIFLVLQTIADLIISEGPRLIEMGFNILIALMNGIAEHPDETIKTILQLITTLSMAILQNLPLLVEAGFNMLTGLINGIIDNLPNIWNAGVQIVQGIVDGIWSVWNDLVEWWSNLWNGLFGNNEVGVTVNEQVTTAGGGSYVSGPSAGGGGAYKPGGYLNGSHANGLGYVPFDGYIAELHKGERVLTASENQDYNKPITIIVQSVLDGRVIGEQVTKYQRQKARAFG